MSLPSREGAVALGRAAGGAPRPGAEFRPLSGLAADHVFLNPGLLFCAGNLDVDPIADYWERSGFMAASRPKFFRAKSPIFRGMPIRPHDEDWSRLVLIVGREYWEGLFDRLRAVSAIDRARSTYWQTTWQPLPLLDPSAEGSATIEVVLFGIDGTAGRWGCSATPGDLAPRASWPVGATRPTVDVLAIGRQLLSDSHQPFRQIEPGSFDEHIPRIDVRRILGE